MVITSYTRFAYKKTKSRKNTDPHLAHLEPANQLKKKSTVSTDSQQKPQRNSVKTDLIHTND